jgi:Winged helix DNA-binding domain
MPTDLLRQRLHNQKLTRSRFRTPADVVSWLGALQAQDYPGARWALGLRASNLTDADVERAFNEGAILRTHVMRPTWHFVTPADIRWLLALTAPRVRAGTAYYDRLLELDSAVLSRSRKTLERALEGGKTLTRKALSAALECAGVAASGQRLSHLMMHAELDGVICSGAMRGKQHTYALLEERVPPAKPLSREESLAELTRRYFSSHGPATVRDYTWWSGLTAREAREGIALVKPALVQESIDGLTYWFAPSKTAAPPSAPTAHLLPNYDEYLIAYKDRDMVVKSTGNGPMRLEGRDTFAHFLIVDGRLAGIWRRTITRGAVVVETAPRRRLTRDGTRALAAAVERFARFVNAPVTVRRER